MLVAFLRYYVGATTVLRYYVGATTVLRYYVGATTVLYNKFDALMETRNWPLCEFVLSNMYYFITVSQPN